MRESGCKWCGTILSVSEKRYRNSRHKVFYCDRVCKDNDHRRKERPCSACGTLTSNVKYCKLGCQQAWQKDRRVHLWLQRELQGHSGKTLSLRKWVRDYLKEVRGSQCSQCGWDDRHPLDNSSLTEVDHIDGDASSSWIENLRILCPNCHSKTATFRARNKNSKRDRKK